MYKVTILIYYKKIVIIKIIVIIKLAVTFKAIVITLPLLYQVMKRLKAIQMRQYRLDAC